MWWRREKQKREKKKRLNDEAGYNLPEYQPFDPRPGYPPTEHEIESTELAIQRQIETISAEIELEITTVEQQLKAVIEQYQELVAQIVATASPYANSYYEQDIEEGSTAAYPNREWKPNLTALRGFINTLLTGILTEAQDPTYQLDIAQIVNNILGLHFYTNPFHDGKNVYFWIDDVHLYTVDLRNLKKAVQVEHAFFNVPFNIRSDQSLLLQIKQLRREIKTLKSKLNDQDSQKSEAMRRLNCR